MSTLRTSISEEQISNLSRTSNLPNFFTGSDVDFPHLPRVIEDDDDLSSPSDAGVSDEESGISRTSSPLIDYSSFVNYPSSPINLDGLRSGETYYPPCSSALAIDRAACGLRKRSCCSCQSDDGSIESKRSKLDNDVDCRKVRNPHLDVPSETCSSTSSGSSTDMSHKDILSPNTVTENLSHTKSNKTANRKGNKNGLVQDNNKNNRSNSFNPTSVSVHSTKSEPPTSPSPSSSSSSSTAFSPLSLLTSSLFRASALSSIRSLDAYRSSSPLHIASHRPSDAPVTTTTPSTPASTPPLKNSLISHSSHLTTRTAATTAASAAVAALAAAAYKLPSPWFVPSSSYTPSSSSMPSSTSPSLSCFSPTAAVSAANVAAAVNAVAAANAIAPPPLPPPNYPLITPYGSSPPFAPFIASAHSALAKLIPNGASSSLFPLSLWSSTSLLSSSSLSPSSSSSSKSVPSFSSSSLSSSSSSFSSSFSSSPSSLSLISPAPSPAPSPSPPSSLSTALSSSKLTASAIPLPSLSLSLFPSPSPPLSRELPFLAMHEDPNPGFRPYMEDRTSTCLVGSTCYVAVYDGHGGCDASIYLQKHLVEAIRRKLLPGRDVQVALRSAFIEINDAFKDTGSIQGSTATAVILNESKLFCANVGDSPAFLIRRNGSVINLIQEHKILGDELTRVAKQAPVFKNTVGMMYMGTQDGTRWLNMSRAFGDFVYPAIICEPFVSTADIADAKYLVVGSDGLTERLTISAVARLVRSLVQEGCLPQDVSRRLVEEAKKSGSTDNISVAVVDLAMYRAQMRREAREARERRRETRRRRRSERQTKAEGERSEEGKHTVEGGEKNQGLGQEHPEQEEAQLESTGAKKRTASSDKTNEETGRKAHKMVENSEQEKDERLKSNPNRLADGRLLDSRRKRDGSEAVGRQMEGVERDLQGDGGIPDRIDGEGEGEREVKRRRGAGKYEAEMARCVYE